MVWEIPLSSERREQADFGLLRREKDGDDLLLG